MAVASQSLRKRGTKDHSGGSSAATGGISVSHLTKTFQSQTGTVTALADVNIEINDGEIVALLGPSGCGKTTTLRCIAGLESPDAGRIDVLGRTVVDTSTNLSVPPEKRHLGMVFQSYALWPHMTVFDNVAYPLKRRKVDKREIAEQVGEMLDMVGCGQFKERYPGQLSGGQQQRIALARALVGNPNVLLFDEPLSNLDAKLRDHMRFEILELHDRFKFAAVYVTHDQVEAMTIANRIAVMRAGEIIQLGSAREIYSHPTDRGVADFMGAATFLPGTVREASGSSVQVETPIGTIPARAVADGALRVGQSAQVCARPEHLRLVPEDELGSARGDFQWLPCTLHHSSFQGSFHVRLVNVNGVTVRIDTPSHLSEEEEQKLAGRSLVLGVPNNVLYAYE